MPIADRPAISEPYTYLHQLLDAPKVFVVSSGILFRSGVALALSRAGNDDVHIVVQPAWNFERQAIDLAGEVAAIRQTHPRAHFMFMCSTMAECRALRRYGMDAQLIHKNAFIDDAIFRPMPEATRKYDAVHIANVEPFKRHYLAWGVPNIAVITYCYREKVDLAELSGYRQVGFSNYEFPSSINVMLPQDVRKIICAAACGLVLSAEEGANNASTEYLLCGIPVVSTPSRGGRDRLFEPDHVRIVDPVPQVIERAVSHFNKAPIDPFAIRSAVLAKMMRHREKLIRWLGQLGERDLLVEAGETLWLPHFRNKLRTTVELGD